MPDNFEEEAALFRFTFRLPSTKWMDWSTTEKWFQVIDAGQQKHSEQKTEGKTLILPS